MKYLVGFAVMAVALFLFLRQPGNPVPAGAPKSAPAELPARSETAAAVERPLEETRKVLEQVRERNGAEEF